MDLITDLSLALSIAGAGILLALLKESQSTNDAALDEAVVPIRVEEPHS